MNRIGLCKPLLGFASSAALILSLSAQAQDGLMAFGSPAGLRGNHGGDLPMFEAQAGLDRRRAFSLQGG